MKTVKLCLLTGLALGLPLAAAAQQNVDKAARSDIHYRVCKRWCAAVLLIFAD
jgi:hypothetical protein